MSLVLDTDPLVDVLRGHPPAVQWLASLGRGTEIKVPGFVAMELVHGARNRREQERVEKLLEPHQILWPTDETCRRAWMAFRRFHLSHGIGILDVLIGQMAADGGFPLCTFNSRHFTGIQGLRLIEPYPKGR